MMSQVGFLNVYFQTFKHTFNYLPSNLVSYIGTHILSNSTFKVMVQFFCRDTNNKNHFAELYICTEEQ